MMKNSNRLMLLGGVVGLMLTAVPPVFADNGMWPSADSNKDGSIDRAEFDGGRAAHFKTIDTNGDGFLTADEMTAFRAAHRAKMEARQGDMGARFLKRFDTDSDGKVSEAEWPQKGRMTFADADGNKDGAVTADELAKVRPLHDGKQKDGKDRFTRLDTDKDGKISATEWTALGDKMFARLDDNSDGTITKDELPKHRGGDAPAAGQPPAAP